MICTHFVEIKCDLCTFNSHCFFHFPGQTLWMVPPAVRRRIWPLTPRHLFYLPVKKTDLAPIWLVGDDAALLTAHQTLQVPPPGVLRGNTALPQFHYMQNWNEFNRMCLSLSHRMSHTLFCFFITGTRHQLQKIPFTSKHIVCCFLYLKKKNQFSWGLVLFLSFCDVVSLGSVRHQQWFSPKSQSVLLV